MPKLNFMANNLFGTTFGKNKSKLTAHADVCYIT